jgi:transposase
MTADHPPKPPSPHRTPRRIGRPPLEISPELRKEIVRLRAHYGTRQVSRRVGLSRKIVRRVLSEERPSPPPPPSPLEITNLPTPTSKLDPFRERIATLTEKGLTTTRMLREIESLGFTGGRTILAELVRTLRRERGLLPHKTVKRRFETGPGEEMQIDWSPYVVAIAGRPTTVHALGCLLCASRKLYLRFFRDERQSTLLEGLALAFAYFDGVARRVVLDNMSTAVLGRFLPGGRPLWHPRFLDFARHYGFEPFACRVRDPDRKGKKEKSFRLVFDDFLHGSDFSSFEDLDQRRMIWLDQTPGVANLRIHGTTRSVPNQAFLAERPFLIGLPDRRFPVHEDSVRVVDQDATLSIRGTPYTVPAALAARPAAVRLYADHFEVLDPHGRVAFSRRYVPDQEKGKLQIDPTHYATLPRRPRDGSGDGLRLDEAFLKRFPSLAPFLEGLRLRMKALAPIHIRALLRLLDRYGEEALVKAVSRAQTYRRFDASAVKRILEHSAEPLPDADPIPPLGGTGPAVLGEIEAGSLAGYAHLDHTPAQEPLEATPTPVAATTTTTK